MKKILIFSLLFISAPVFATCAIDNFGACSVAELNNASMQSSFINSETTLPSYMNNSEISLPRNSDTERGVDRVRDFGAQSSDYSYNTDCQFGICNEGGATKLFEDRTSK